MLVNDTHGFKTSHCSANAFCLHPLQCNSPVLHMEKQGLSQANLGLPRTQASLPLKTGGKGGLVSFPFWGPAYFQGFWLLVFGKVISGDI